MAVATHRLCLSPRDPNPEVTMQPTPAPPTPAPSSPAPSSPANPDARAAVIVQAVRRVRLRVHVRRIAVVSSFVLVVAAAASVYFSLVGTTECWEEDEGERCVERSWYALTFQQASEVETLDGTPDGVRRDWYRNGELWFQSGYERGKRVGHTYEFWPTGTPRFLGTYSRDVLHGTEAWWYEDGRMEWQVYRHRGDRHGQEISWHPNGARKRVGNFSHGERDGEFEHFLLDGTHGFSSQYVAGVRIDGRDG